MLGPAAMYKENDLLLFLRPHTHIMNVCAWQTEKVININYRVAKYFFLTWAPTIFSHTACNSSHQVDVLLKNPYIDLARNL